MRIRKLRSKRGETIPETLVALLFVTFGSVIFASLVMISKKVISGAKTNYQMFIRAHNTMETRIGGSDADSDPDLTKDTSVQKISIRGAISVPNDIPDNNLEHFEINSSSGASENIDFYTYSPRNSSGGEDEMAAGRYPYYFYTAH